MEKEVALEKNKRQRNWMMRYRPMFDKIIVTANRKRISDGGIILTTQEGANGRLLTTQTVLRAGENTPDYIKEGTIIELDMGSFPKKMIKQAAHDIGPDTYEVQPPLYEDDEGSEFMLMSIRNILYVIDPA